MIMLTNDDLSWLEGSSLMMEAVMNRNGLNMEFKTLAEKVPGFDTKYSPKEFMETYKMVTSKGF